MSADEIQFSDEHFMSAAEKKRVLRAWIRFLQSGCKKAQFTQDLYHHLIQHYSFIAHYERNSFYHIYFERLTPEMFRFFDEFDPQKPRISAEYGSPPRLPPLTTERELNP